MIGKIIGTVVFLIIVFIVIGAYNQWSDSIKAKYDNQHDLIANKGCTPIISNQYGLVTEMSCPKGTDFGPGWTK